MTANDVLKELKSLGTEAYANIMRRHLAAEPIYGVKVEDMKKIQKRIKKDYQLALDLYDSGVYDAMYLAGLIADDARMTKDDLQHWAAKATCRGLSSATVAWVAAGSAHGWELGREWIDSPEPLVAVAGWATLGSYLSITDDARLDLEALNGLLQRVGRTIHEAPDAVRYQMNSFVIAAGSYVPALTETAIHLAEQIGPVMADLGNNACQVPFAPDYIRKVQDRGTIGKKRKTAKC